MSGEFDQLCEALSNVDASVDQWKSQLAGEVPTCGQMFSYDDNTAGAQLPNWDDFSAAWFHRSGSIYTRRAEEIEQQGTAEEGTGRTATEDPLLRRLREDALATGMTVFLIGPPRRRPVRTLRRECRSAEVTFGLEDRPATRAHDAVNQFLDRVHPQVCLATLRTCNGDLVSLQFDWFELTEEGPQPRQEVVEFSREESNHGLRRPPRRFLR